MAAQNYVFAGNDGISGHELWVTDGTETGTTLLKDITTGGNNSNPSNFTALGNGKVLFSAYDPTNSTELWVTDGTSAGTTLLKDINPGTGASNPSNFASLRNGTAVFQATDPVNGQELWVTDGTSTGTKLLKDINPGTSNANPNNIVFVGDGKALFRATDPDNGSELWVTDGTSAGTTLVKDINPGTAFGSPNGFVPLGDGRTVFRATDAANGAELWVTDGTAAGTSLVKDIYPGASFSSQPLGMVFAGNGKAVFECTTGTYGRELWVTDGTSAGTFLLRDIYPGTRDSEPVGLVSIGDGTVLFRATADTGGQELWITDGTIAGTRLVKDINPSGSSSPSLFTVLDNGKVVFRANDGTNGQELWITDGTEVGTSLLKNINPGANAASAPLNFTPMSDGRVMFSATDGTGYDVWITDGTAAGTTRVKDINTLSIGQPQTGFTPASVPHTDLAPSLTATGMDPTFTEGAGAGVQGTAMVLFTGAAIDAREAGQTVTGLTFTVTGLKDGAHETVLVDGLAVALTDGAAGTTTANGVGYAVTVAGGVATVALSLNLSAADAAALLEGLAYRNTNVDAPSAGERVFTLTAIADSGSTANGGGNLTSGLAIASTVTVVPTDDAPAANDDTLSTDQRGTPTGNVLSGGTADGDPDGGGLTVTQVDFGATTKSVAGPTVIAGAYGSLTIGTDGSYTYDARTEGNLAVGETKTDDFTYTVQGAGGLTHQAHLRVTVTGTPNGDANDNLFRIAADGYAVDGRGGADTVSYATRNGGVIVELDGANVTQVLDGDGTTVIGTLAHVEHLRGSAFADKLTGDAGNNVIEGGAGADLIDGDGGTDTASYQHSALGVTVDLSLGSALQAGQGDAAGDRLFAIANLLGSAQADALTGNGDANLLNGGAGADTLSGLSGSDSYIVDNVGDQVVEAAGSGSDDRVYVAGNVTFTSYTLAAGQDVETLATSRAVSTRSLDLTGNDKGQAICGNQGANVLDGKDGTDTLNGYGGADTFVFSTTLGANNVDRIVDFTSADTIRLEKSVFSALDLGTLDASAFKDLSVSGASVDASDRILYDAKGRLFYDADGAGGEAAVLFARVSYTPTLTHDDFLVA